jgi:hypothetical protein
MAKFKKGQSGNPSGRPKDPHNVAALARSYGPEAVEKLKSLMDDPATPHKVQHDCACSLLDRGFGKPAQAVAVAAVASVSAGDGSGISALLAVARAENVKLGLSEAPLSAASSEAVAAEPEPKKERSSPEKFKAVFGGTR